MFYSIIRRDVQGSSKGALSYIGNIAFYDDYLFSAGTQYRSTPYNNITILTGLYNKNMTIREWTIPPEESYFSSGKWYKCRSFYSSRCNRYFF